MIKDKESFKTLYSHLFSKVIGDKMEEGQVYDHYKVVTRLIMDEINEKWACCKAKMRTESNKEVFYFSIEFLIGKMLKQYLIELDLYKIVEEGLNDFGINLDELAKFEAEPGLGNGGLGRLAACFISSMAFKGVASTGVGIRYKHGLFTQKFVNGYQMEFPDNWLRHEYPFEVRKAKASEIVKFYGKIRTEIIDNKLTFFHEDYEAVKAVPYDYPIVGYHKEDSVNKLRLWNAEPVSDFDLQSFNQGDFIKAVSYQSLVESITQVLYPNDDNYEGKMLRLKQQYFFVSAGLQSIIRNYKKHNNNSIEGIDKKICIHINDTHPSLCIPELMRILIDDEKLPWEQAWNITSSIVSYTNHTIMPESMEIWSVDMLRHLLPRIYLIIEEIDKRFKDYLNNYYKGNNDLYDMYIIKDKHIHMANLAVHGSYSINGVAKIHTKLLKEVIFKNFYLIYPKRFNNKTNGVDHRRFLLKANPTLSNVITEGIGDSWIENPWKLSEILNYLYDNSFREKVSHAKQENKKRLANYIRMNSNINVNPYSLFDIQVKRIHAYKRQLLNVLHILHLYNQIMNNPNTDIYPRTFIFAGKAAPGYYYAKAIIKLIHMVADKVNNEPLVKDKIKVVFLDNFNVTLSELIYPAADVSEQISTASKEASGTGNMKFMMNGAITLATLDGANIEILEQVGSNNIIIFGLNAKEVLRYYKHQDYNPYEIYQNDVRIQKVINQLTNGFFDEGKMELHSIYDSLLVNNDEFFVIKDFSSYVDAQQEVNYRYLDKERWLTMSINNIAHSGIFSSDRSIDQYTNSIWNIRV